MTFKQPIPFQPLLWFASGCDMPNFVSAGLGRSCAAIMQSPIRSAKIGNNQSSLLWNVHSHHERNNSRAHEMNEWCVSRVRRGTMPCSPLNIMISRSLKGSRYGTSTSHKSTDNQCQALGKSADHLCGARIDSATGPAIWYHDNTRVIRCR